jgi:hypothetical protein
MVSGIVQEMDQSPGSFSHTAKVHSSYRRSYPSSARRVGFGVRANSLLYLDTVYRVAAASGLSLSQARETATTGPVSGLYSWQMFCGVNRGVCGAARPLCGKGRV